MKYSMTGQEKMFNSYKIFHARTRKGDP